MHFEFGSHMLDPSVSRAEIENDKMIQNAQNLYKVSAGKVLVQTLNNHFFLNEHFTRGL